MSDQLSAISDQLEPRPKGSPDTEGNGSTGLRCVVCLGPRMARPGFRAQQGQRSAEMERHPGIENTPVLLLQRINLRHGLMGSFLSPSERAEHRSRGRGGVASL